MSIGRKAAIGALISIGGIVVTWAVLLSLVSVIYSTLDWVFG
jgi:hypothetical protein